MEGWWKSLAENQGGSLKAVRVTRGLGAEMLTLNRTVGFVVAAAAIMLLSVYGHRISVVQFRAVLSQ